MKSINPQTEIAYEQLGRIQNPLTTSEERDHAFAGLTPQIVWTARPDGSLDYFNQCWIAPPDAHGGVTPGRGWETMLHPDDLQRSVDNWTKAVQMSRTYEDEHRLNLVADGAYRRHLTLAVPLYDDCGRILKWLGTCTDTEKIKREAKTRGPSLDGFAIAEDAFIGKDMEGNIVTWNQGARRLYGYRAEEIMGLCSTVLMPPELPDELPWILDTICHGAALQYYETVRVRKDGKRIEVSLTLSPIKNRQGKITGVAGIERYIGKARLPEVEFRPLNAALEELASISRDLQGVTRGSARSAKSLKRDGLDQLAMRTDDIIKHAVIVITQLRLLLGGGPLSGVDSTASFLRKEEADQPLAQIGVPSKP